LTQADFARHRGVSRKTVTAWKHAGYLVWQDGKIDRDASDALLDSRHAPKGASAPPAGQPDRSSAAAGVQAEAPPQSEAILRTLIDGADLLTEAEAKRVKENYLALQRRLEYERQSGELVPIDQVEREYADRCQRIRSRLLALPNEVAGAIAQRVGGNAGEVRSIVQENVNDVLEELAHGQGGGN
jgi:hypothetical protein